MADTDVLLHRLVEDVDLLKTAAVEHRVRLENGVKVFADQKERLERIEQKIEPKQPSVSRIIGVTLAVVIAGAGALWALANMLRDRPTVEQIESIVDLHDEVGHKGIREDVGQIKVEQGAQRALIEGVVGGQKEQGGKLDQLLEQTERRSP